MEINDRVKKLIRLLANNKQSIFSKTTGIPKTTLNGIVSPPFNDPSFKSLRKILDAYPKINMQWLLYDIGEPLTDQPKKELSQHKKEELNKTDTEISERVQLVINRFSSNRNSFAADLGYAKSQTIYDITDGKSAPSFDFFRRFMLSEYSAIISINWLLTGRDKMIIDSESENNLEPVENPTDSALLKMIRKLCADNAILEKKLESKKKK